MKNVANSKQKNNFVTSNVMNIPSSAFKLPQQKQKQTVVNTPVVKKSTMKQAKKVESKNNEADEYQTFLKLQEK